MNNIYREDNGDVNIDEEVTLLSVRNAGIVRVGVDEERPCCKEEGFVPEEGEVCCDGMPRDRGNGACGCPNGLDWDPDLGCRPVAGGICWSSDEDEREDIALCLARELSINFFLNNLFVNNQYNQDILGCFNPRPNQGNPTQVCCPYMGYDGSEYGEFQDIVVY